MRLLVKKKGDKSKAKLLRIKDDATLDDLKSAAAEKLKISVSDISGIYLQVEEGDIAEIEDIDDLENNDTIIIECEEKSALLLDTMNTFKVPSSPTTKPITQKTKHKWDTIIPDVFQAAYAISLKNPLEYLNSKVSSHTVESIEISINKPKFMIAKHLDKHVITIAFSTPSNWQSLLSTNEKDEQVKEYYHSGFYEYVKRMPYMYFMNLLALGKRLIFTGIGIGGSLACMCACILFQKCCSMSESANPNINCITFGSPLIGKEALGSWLSRRNLLDNFCHLTSTKDFMPVLLSLSEKARICFEDNISYEDDLLYELQLFDYYLINNLTRSLPRKKTQNQMDSERFKMKDILKRWNDQMQDKYLPFGTFYAMNSNKPVYGCTNKYPLEKIFPVLELFKMKEKEILTIFQNYEANYREYYMEMVNELFPKTFPSNRRRVLLNRENVIKLSMDPIKISAGQNDIVLVVYGTKMEFTISIVIAEKIKITPNQALPKYVKCVIPKKDLLELYQKATDDVFTTIQVIGHFNDSPKTKIPLLDPKVENIRERMIGRMRIGSLVFKSLLSLSLLGNNAKLEKKPPEFRERIIQFVKTFDALQRRITFSDVVLSFLDYETTLSFLEENSISYEDYKEQMLKFLKSYERPIQVKKSNLSYFKEIVDDDVRKAMEELGIRLYKKRYYNMQGEPYFHFTLTCPFENECPQSILLHDIKYLELETIKKELSILLRAIEYSICKPEYVSLDRSSGQVALLNLLVSPVHLIALPLDVVLGMIGAGAGAISLGVQKDQDSSILWEGLRGGIIGAISGSLAIHTLIVLALMKTNRNFASYEEKLKLLMMKYGIPEDPLLHSDEQLYHIEKQLTLPEGSIGFWGSDTLKQWTESAIHLRTLRDLLIQAPGIGIVGTSKTGKSWFINQVWGYETNPGAHIPTTSINAYSNEGVGFFVFDFPGCDDVDPIIANCLKNGYELVSMFIVILDIEKINISQKGVVDLVSKSGVEKFLICLNRADRFYDELQKHGHVTEYDFLNACLAKFEMLSKDNDRLEFGVNVVCTCFHVDRRIISEEDEKNMKQWGVWMIEDVVYWMKENLNQPPHMIEKIFAKGNVEIEEASVEEKDLMAKKRMSTKQKKKKRSLPPCNASLDQVLDWIENVAVVEADKLDIAHLRSCKSTPLSIK